MEMTARPVMYGTPSIDQVFDARTAAREEARLWRVVYDGRGRVKEDEEEEEEEEEEGEDEKGEEGPETGRRSALVDLGANWREYIEYYSEWEVTGGKRRVAEDSNTDVKD